MHIFFLVVRFSVVRFGYGMKRHVVIVNAGTSSVNSEFVTH